jgi:peptidoglycan/xylan/chitin deacetylase (PgdA/CDA1 family)
VRLSGLNEDDERALIETTLNRISAAVGQRPRSWLGPGLAESARTPDILHAAGVEYVCDWVADDLPFTLAVEGGGELLSLPYTTPWPTSPGTRAAGWPRARRSWTTTRAR